MFLDFFKIKKTKTKTKHVHKQLKELNHGQVSNTHLRESFLTHIARVFGFVDENSWKVECIWGITPIFWERLKSCKFLSQANKLKFFKSIWNNLFGLMAGEISSHIVDWNTECLDFNLWQLGRMWPWTPQKWKTGTNLGTSVPNRKSILRFWFLPQQRTIWSNMTNNTTKVTSRHKNRFIMLSNSRFRHRFRNFSVYIRTFTFV